MRHFVGALLGLVVLLMVASIAQAAIVEQTYTFTGADLVNNVFGSYRHSDGSLKAYEGMRSIYSTPAGGTPAGATYLGTSGTYYTNFNNLWNTAVADERVLDYFWLSGNNGYSGQWGEDYKPLEWISGTGPNGWTFSTDGDGDPVWTTSENGLALSAANLADQDFFVTIKFDTEDMWYENPNNYLYGCNTAPNSLNGLTMYFGSYLSDPDGDPVNRYVGNMFAAAVPEPATLFIWSILGGLGFVFGWRRKRAA